MAYVRVTCLKGKLTLPPGDFERDVLEEGESVIVSEKLRPRIFHDTLVDQGIVKVGLPSKIAEGTNLQRIYSSGEKPIGITSIAEDILDQNTATVKSIVKERNYPSAVVKKLLKFEKKKGKRKDLIDFLKSVIKKGV